MTVSWMKDLLEREGSGGYEASEVFSVFHNWGGQSMSQNSGWEG